MKPATTNKIEPAAREKDGSRPGQQVHPASNWEKKLEKAKKSLEYVDLSEERLNQLRKKEQKNPPAGLSPEEAKRMEDDYIFELFSLVQQQETTIKQLQKTLLEKDRTIKELRQQSRQPSK